MAVLDSETMLHIKAMIFDMTRRRDTLIDLVDTIDFLRTENDRLRKELGRQHGDANHAPEREG